MKKLIVGTILVALMNGCATRNVALNPAKAALYRGKTITYSVHEKPSFSAMTAGKAGFGALGAAGMNSAGNKLVQENKVPDPAVRIADTLAKDLAGMYNLSVIRPEKRAESRKPAKVAAEHSYGDIVLDVQTKNWMFCYMPLDWNNYRVMYAAKLKLIDTKTAEVLASASYVYNSKDSGVYPSYDELTDNQAAGLKRFLKKAEVECISEMRERIFRK
ncbi:MAG: hypothetical protein ABFR47_05665 [Verrucomicrobiota bacterium]